MNQELDLNTIIQKIIWWKKPEQALTNKKHVLAYAMTYGTLNEVVFLLNEWGRDAFIATLQDPPAGVFDVRSWHFWHLYLHQPLRPLPKRF